MHPPQIINFNKRKVVPVKLLDFLARFFAGFGEAVEEREVVVGCIGCVDVVMAKAEIDVVWTS